ncbi:efflux RND transporter periplasmic adaptor subunit [Candidatus Parcubacteria bacterium]|nr:efflux RND transporter periplasmic adaptor subunit [Candidatus Parcubacteria bacterium]
MFQKSWDFIKRKKWWVIVTVVILIVVLLASGKKKEEYLFETVAIGDVEETILATGQVVSDTDLTLSFSQSGIVSSIPVKLGQKIYKGQILASLQNRSALANLTQAEAARDRAEAAYQQLLDGSTSEAIEVARVAVRNAEIDYAQSKIQQDRLVENYKRTLLSGGLEAVPEGSSSETAPTISGTYNGEEEGVYRIRMYSSGSGNRFSINGLEVGDGSVDTSKPVAIGTKGLFIQFSSSNALNTTWVVEIPNKKSSSYVTNLNAYEAALETRDISLTVKQSVIDTARANLNNLLADATNSEVLLAKSDILSAQGRVDAALAAVEDTRIRAPKSGTITRIDANPGELIQAYSNAIVLQDVDQLLLEANINEANINKVKPGMPVEITFDALSFDEVFMAEVTSIDISSTLVSGVVNYRIKASLVDDLPNLRPGMTANMTLIVDKKEGVLSIPGRAVIEKDDKTYVLKKNGNDVEEIEISVGFKGGGSLFEVIEGLAVEDEIVINP